MNNYPSYIEIDGLRIEAKASTVLTYVLAVKNALNEIESGDRQRIWLSTDGFYNTATPEQPEARLRSMQGVYLHAQSNVRYEVVEDEHSAPSFDDGTLGNAGQKFLDKYAPLSDEDDESSEPADTTKAGAL